MVWILLLSDRILLGPEKVLAREYVSVLSGKQIEVKDHNSFRSHISSQTNATPEGFSSFLINIPFHFEDKQRHICYKTKDIRIFSSRCQRRACDVRPLIFHMMGLDVHATIETNLDAIGILLSGNTLS